ARGRLLEGRCGTTLDATHLWHGFLYAGRAGRLGKAARGGREARSSPARPGTRPVFDSGKLWAGPGAVAPEGGNRSPADGGLSPRRTGPTELQRGVHAAHRQTRTVAAERAPTQLMRFNIY